MVALNDLGEHCRGGLSLDRMPGQYMAKHPSSKLGGHGMPYEKMV